MDQDPIMQTRSKVSNFKFSKRHRRKSLLSAIFIEIVVSIACLSLAVQVLLCQSQTTTQASPSKMRFWSAKAKTPANGNGNGNGGGGGSNVVKMAAPVIGSASPPTTGGRNKNGATVRPTGAVGSGARSGLPSRNMNIKLGQQPQHRMQQQQQQQQEPLQVSITPRVDLVRVPVGSNAILKCLVSAQTEEFTRRFRMHWSRYLYDENVHEQIETASALNDDEPQVLPESGDDNGATDLSEAGESDQRRRRSKAASSISKTKNRRFNRTASSDATPAAGDDAADLPMSLSGNRQQQLREFLSRSRQETNKISDLLMEATLSISPVKAGDNATYYCAATDGRHEQAQARVDLVALSRPMVRLDRLEPARDSRSALVHWTIMSDGNTPIKRTILMARNDSATLRGSSSANSQVADGHLSTANRFKWTQQSSLSQQVAAGQKQPIDDANATPGPTVVIDSERQQWQRYDIEADGNEWSMLINAANNNNNNNLRSSPNNGHHLLIEDDHVVRAGGSDGDADQPAGTSLRNSSRPTTNNDDNGDTDYGISSETGGNGVVANNNNNNYSGSSNKSSDTTTNDGLYFSSSTVYNNNNSNANNNNSNRRNQSARGRNAFRNRVGLHQRSRQRWFNLTQLLPGVTYQLRLAAINDMGQSDWSQLVATMPNDIPAQISEVYLLSKSNDSLAIGWRRPAYDGAKTLRYEMQLFDLNRTLTLDANTTAVTTTSLINNISNININNTYNAPSTTTPQPIYRTNFMYVFVNLKPGTDYHFHVRACSKAGCGVYSQPKLLASTDDGEPDEPIDVELICNQKTGNVSVSWLPPANVRGQLLNYTVTLESRAYYRNQSGLWTQDEWRTSLETNDNHTLTLESDGLLVPNTNYTARVCANNRSQTGCGRTSVVSSRAQCSTMPTLPNELPENVRLKTKALNLPQQRSAETLVLEIPFISWRNGSIDCVQIVLIRLPKSFDANKHQLSQYLPADPSQIKVVKFADLNSEEQNSNSNSNHDEEGQIKTGAADADIKTNDFASNAYLAEELEQRAELSDLELEAGMQQVALGDGAQQTCESVWRRVSGSEANLDYNLTVYDGPLKAQTYYTGFLRLIQLRPAERIARSTITVANQPISKRDTEPLGDRSISSNAQQVTVQSKYSSYFSPIKTGDFVLEIVAATGGPGDKFKSSGGATDSPSFNLFGAQTLVGNLFGQNSRAYELTKEFGAKVDQYYRSGSNYLDAKMDELSKFIIHSSPPMQLLEIGFLVLCLSLIILFVIYLCSLPAAIRRRKKKRKARKKARNQQINNNVQSESKAAMLHIEHHPQQYPLNQQQTGDIVEISTNPNPAQYNNAVTSYPMAMQTNDPMHQINGNMQQEQLMPGEIESNQQQHLPEQNECPIHSSPLIHPHQQHQQPYPNGWTDPQVSVANNNIALYGNQDQQQLYQQQQPPPQQQLVYHPVQPQQQPVEEQQQQDTMRHHWHHGDYGQEINAPDAVMYDRQCRTLRRMPSGQQQQQQAEIEQHWQHHKRRASHTQVQQIFGNQVQGQPMDASQQLHSGAMATGSSLNIDATKHLTLSHAQTSILGLAKRINKSIPLSLFRQVFEIRLRNGWLRDEYDQLPSEHLTRSTTGAPPNGSIIRLRPQLIVSRDDSMSALISGNDHYDASLIRQAVTPVGSGANGFAASAGAGGKLHRDPINEKRFICARSPLDADSVWDFWRLVYEQEVSSLVMLIPCEDANSGELRCVQYWPTSDNEETTILSPCNEYVQASTILPAKFKIRQETIVDESVGGNPSNGNRPQPEFVVRRLTLMVMGTRAREHETTSATTATTMTPHTTALSADHHQADLNNGQAPDGADSKQQPKSGAGEAANAASKRGSKCDGDGDGNVNGPNKHNGRGSDSAGEVDVIGKADDNSGVAVIDAAGAGASAGKNNDAGNNNDEADEAEDDDDDDDERYIIVEREILHFQFAHWNASSAQNRRRLMRFIDFVNERHMSVARAQMSPGAMSQSAPPMLVHCSNGLGRSGLFVTMSLVLNELRSKLAASKQDGGGAAAGPSSPKVNLFTQVAKLRQQRDNLLSPYRFYELLYQLTADCIPKDVSLDQFAAAHSVSSSQSSAAGGGSGVVAQSSQGVSGVPLASANHVQQQQQQQQQQTGKPGAGHTHHHHHHHLMYHTGNNGPH